MTPEPATRLVRMSEELFQHLGASAVDWGEPDEIGAYTPTVYREAAAPQPAEAGVEAAEWHRYLHQEGILVPDEGEECGPWHHRVFLARAYSGQPPAAPQPAEAEAVYLLGEATRRRLTLDEYATVRAALANQPAAEPLAAEERRAHPASRRITQSEGRAARRANQPAAETAGLDVERLARAGDAVANRFGWAPVDASEWGIPDDEYWKALATEYARLAVSDPEAGGES